MVAIKGLVLAMVLQAGVAAAGTERGGGTSPAPIFMPEDVAFRCELKLTQLGSSLQIHRALVSRAEHSVAWKKGEYAGHRGIDLVQISGWKHYEMKQIGPIHPTEVEVAIAPAGAKFEGFLAFGVEYLLSPSELGVVLTAGLLSGTAASGHGVSQAYTAESISSRANLIGNVRYIKRGPATNHEDERRLEVRCVRSP